MLRILLFAACAVTIAGCDTFRDYSFQVKSPTTRSDVQEEPYYDYNRRETIYPR